MPWKNLDMTFVYSRKTLSGLNKWVEFFCDVMYTLIRYFWVLERILTILV